MSFGWASMAARWAVVRGRAATVSAPCRARATWLISGLMHAYCYGKAPVSCEREGRAVGSGDAFRFPGLKTGKTYPFPTVVIGMFSGYRRTPLFRECFRNVSWSFVDDGETFL